MTDEKEKKEDDIEAAYIRGQRSIATRMLSKCFSALEGEDLERAALLKIIEETRVQTGFLARDIGARKYHPKLHPGDVIASIIAPKLKELGVMDGKDDRPIWRLAPERCEIPGYYWVDQGIGFVSTDPNEPTPEPKPKLKFFEMGERFAWREHAEDAQDISDRPLHRYRRVSGPVDVKPPVDE